MGIAVGILQEGLIFSIMALGVYISLKILDFPDLSVDGTFPLGMAVTTFLILRGVNPFLCLLLSFAAGCAAGCVTGLLNVKLKIKDLLSGIITMTALYSINYTIVGKPNEFLAVDQSTVFSIIPAKSGDLLFQYKYLIVAFAAMLIAKKLLDAYLCTKSGFLLRSVGDNENLVVTLAENPGTVKIIGLALGNGLVALAGSLNLQYMKSFNVSAGTGTLVMGLAAVIIGTTLFSKAKHFKITTGVVVGMIIYKACISLAMLCGLQAKDTNLVISVLFVITLVLNSDRVKGRKGGSADVRA